MEKKKNSFSLKNNFTDNSQFCSKQIKKDTQTLFFILCVCEVVCHSTHIDVRRQLCGIGSLLHQVVSRNRAKVLSLGWK